MDVQVYPDITFDEFEYYGDLAGATAVEDIGAVFGFLFAFLAVIYVIALVFGIAQYVINGVSIMRLAKKVGLPNGWLGFIPFADVYMLGKIADAGSEKKVNAKRLLVTEIVFCVLLVVYLVLSFAMGFASEAASGAFVGLLVAFLFVALLYLAAAICLTVFTYIAYYRISQDFGGNSATAWFVGIILGGFLVSSLVPCVILLILSFKEPRSAVKAADEPVVTVTPDSIF